MNVQKSRPIVSLGMFDLFKGIAITMVILGHTMDYLIYALPTVPPTLHIFQLIFTLIANLFLFGFFIASGYAVRKTSFQKCLKQVKKMFLTPYLYAGIFGILLFLAVNIFVNVVGSGQIIAPIKNALEASLHFAAGLLLGIYPATSYFGWQVPSFVPMWFTIAIAGAWLLLDLILHVKQKWLQIALVVLCAIIGVYVGGFLIQKNIIVPYCIFHALIAVTGLYIGYLSKKYHLFELQPKIWHYLLLVVCVAALLITIDSSISHASLAYPDIMIFAASAFVSLALVDLFVHINRSYHFISNIFEKIGFYSLYVLCVHTVEYMGMHWHLIIQKFPDHPYIDTILIFVLRSAVIFLGIVIIEKYKKLGGWKALKNKLVSGMSKAN